MAPRWRREILCTLAVRRDGANVVSVPRRQCGDRQITTDAEAMRRLRSGCLTPDAGIHEDARMFSLPFLSSYQGEVRDGRDEGIRLPVVGSAGRVCL